MAALLEINNIETWYGPIPALRGVSVNLGAGSITNWAHALPGELRQLQAEAKRAGA